MGHNVIATIVADFSRATGLGTEQISFVCCILMSFIGAFVFRLQFPPITTSRNTRLMISGGFGVWLLYFSWGWKVLIPLADSLVTFLILKYMDPKIAHKVTFILAMMFLCGCHLHHLYNFHKIGRRYSTDFTGPNMILTQRITLLAFNIHDGLHKKEKDLLEDQKKYAIRKFPSFLEYFGYLFGFASIVAGPLVFYKDYMEFIDGTNYKNNGEKDGSNGTDPSSRSSYTKKFITGIVMAVVFVYGSELFPYLRNIDEEFIASTSWLQRVLFLYASLFVCRTKYYLAWSLADAVCNAAGLGFNGYDEKGKPKWDLVSNINIFAIETSTSMKVYIDNWNIMTGFWLRRVCYDRVSPSLKTLATFALSAVWHGFFPGYYMTFLSGHLFTLAQRKVRSKVRPRFQQTANSRAIYEVVTWFATHFSIAYIVVPFVVLEFDASFRFYKSCYFCGHILATLVIVLLPKSKRTRKETDGHANGTSNGQLAKSNGSLSEKGELDGYHETSNGHMKKQAETKIANGTVRHR